jgi:hypothetical protein
MNDDTLEPYVFPIAVADAFADHTYQRPLNESRAAAMAEHFDRRLVGIIEVSDRGQDRSPRYALIEGQHRWAAVRLRDPDAVITARIHTGLSIDEEARLFHDIDTGRRPLSTWDRWKARRAAGDAEVLAIESTVACVGLRIAEAPKDGHIRCTRTLEKIVRSRGGHALLKDSLQLLRDTWGLQQGAYDAPMVAGAALFHSEFADLEHFECERLVDALIDLAPERIGYIARAKRTNGEHSAGPLPKFVALTFLDRYNVCAPAGQRLRTPARFRGTLRAAPATNAA